MANPVGTRLIAKRTCARTPGPWWIPPKARFYLAFQ